jgi:hypothetical protein
LLVVAVVLPKELQAGAVVLVDLEQQVDLEYLQVQL